MLFRSGCYEETAAPLHSKRRTGSSVQLQFGGETKEDNELQPQSSLNCTFLMIIFYRDIEAARQAAVLETVIQLQEEMFIVRFSTEKIY